jgi:hypothetical protein
MDAFAPLLLFVFGGVSPLHNHTEPVDDPVGFEDLFITFDYASSLSPPGPSGTISGTLACP